MMIMMRMAVMMEGSWVLGAAMPTSEMLFGFLACLAFLVVIVEKVMAIVRRKPSLDHRLASHDVKIEVLEKGLEDLRVDVDSRFDGVQERLHGLAEMHRDSIGKVHKRLDGMCKSLSEIAGLLKGLAPQVANTEDRLNRHIEQSPKSGGR